MEERNKWMGLVILAIVAIVAVVGLILLFKADITGSIIRDLPHMPTAGDLGLQCQCKTQGDCIISSVSSLPIPEAARKCVESGGVLGRELSPI